MDFVGDFCPGTGGQCHRSGCHHGGEVMGEKLDELRTQIALKLLEIEEICRYRNAPVENITLIARNPRNDNMFVVVTNEDSAGLGKARELISTMEAN